MLRLTRRSEYGLMALAYLASRPGEYCSVREIVEELKLPKRLLAEVLKDLSRAELLEATRGPGGGYRLTQPAERLVAATATARVAEHGCHSSFRYFCCLEGRPAPRGETRF